MADPEESLPVGTAGNAAANLQPIVMNAEGAGFVFTFSSAILLLTPMSHHVLAYARQKSAAGEHQFAVVLAQAACEWHTEEALSLLIRHKRAELLGNVAMDLIGNTVSLGDRRVRKLYGALTDDYPAGHPERKLAPALWWAAWDTARELRHDVAHKAARVTQAQAQAAIDSVDAYIAHVTAVVERVRAVP